MIGVYQVNKVAHFVLIIAEPIYNEENALKAKTEAFGKYSLELINEHRATLGTNLPTLEWSSDLFEVAYAHAKDISDGKTDVAKLPDADLEQKIQVTLSDVTNFVEEVKIGS